MSFLFSIGKSLESATPLTPFPLKRKMKYGTISTRMFMSNTTTPHQPAQTLKGFRDFLPTEKRQRDFVMEKIKKAFQDFGFEPLETPTLEYASLLLGKYGDEADKLVYTFQDRGERKIGLRYDQTVPTARVLAQYQNVLPKFFRRSQIQNVFRADKPQKGRYREFTQCDIDIFGSTSAVADAEIVACSYQAMKNIGFQEVEIRYNDRQLLFSILKPFATESIDVFSLIQSIDKLDKLPPEKVSEELVQKGLEKSKAVSILSVVNNIDKSDNLREIEQNILSLGVPAESLIFTPSLARGLDYYTGLIFEILLPQYPGSSCGGGGRYDGLIENLGGPSIPAVGVAFGFDRLVDAAVSLDLVPQNQGNTTLLITLFSKEFQKASFMAATAFRQAGISTELYPEVDKLGKQFKLANQKNIPWVLVLGEEEMLTETVTLKNMINGTQQQFSIEEAIKTVQN